MLKNSCGANSFKVEDSMSENMFGGRIHILLMLQRGGHLQPPLRVMNASSNKTLPIISADKVIDGPS